MKVEKLLKFDNVVSINSIEELKKYINVDSINSGVEEIEFKTDDNSLFLFDSPDLNSAFLHEWAVNKLETLSENELQKMKIYHIKSTDEIKKLISQVHLNIGYDWNVQDSKAQKMNPQPKFEVFCIVLISSMDEYFWKSDDFDIVNEQIIQNAIDLLKLN